MTPQAERIIKSMVGDLIGQLANALGEVERLSADNATLTAELAKLTAPTTPEPPAS